MWQPAIAPVDNYVISYTGERGKVMSKTLPSRRSVCQALNFLFSFLYATFGCFCCSVTQSWPTLCDPMNGTHQASLSFIISWSLFKLMSMESVMPSNHLIFCHPLLLPPSIFPSIRFFSRESSLCIRWSKYRSVSFSISPFNEYSVLISFRVDVQRCKGRLLSPAMSLWFSVAT